MKQEIKLRKEEISGLPKQNWVPGRHGNVSGRVLPNSQLIGLQLILVFLLHGKRTTNWRRRRLLEGLIGKVNWPPVDLSRGCRAQVGRRNRNARVDILPARWRRRRWGQWRRGRRRLMEVRLRRIHREETRLSVVRKPLNVLKDTQTQVTSVSIEPRSAHRKIVSDHIRKGQNRTEHEKSGCKRAKASVSSQSLTLGAVIGGRLFSCGWIFTMHRGISEIILGELGSHFQGRLARAS